MTEHHGYSVTADIVYQDHHLVVVNKPVNVPVQTARPDEPTLLSHVEEYLRAAGEKYPFINVVHRIDRPVSGLVIFARSRQALVNLNQAFRDRQVRRVYWAVVGSRPGNDQGHLMHYLVFNPQKNKSYVFDHEMRGSRPAEMKYRMVAQSERYFLLEIELITGRHHQIRSQLSKIGCPVRGDLKYGYPRSNPGGGICLHARSLTLLHPVEGTELTFTADPPVDILWRELQKAFR